MDHTNTKTLSTLAILAMMSGIAGCAGAAPSEPGEATESSIMQGGQRPPPPATAPTPKTPVAPTPKAPAATTDFQENIARLRALRIFEVSALQSNVGETGNCYIAQTVIGVVCVQDVASHAAEIAVAEKKLADFTVLAETEAAKVAKGGPFGPGTNLEALKNLHLFEVGAFIVDQPESHSCYGFCSPSNQKREQQLHKIIEAL